MRQIAIVILTCSLLAGCTEHGFRFGQEEQEPLKNTSPFKASAMLVRPAADGTVTRMIIDGEVVEADEILAPIRGDLEEKSKNMPPDTYAGHAIDRIGRAVSERIAEALLHQEASNRLGKDEGKAIDAAVDSELRARITRDYGGVQRRYENFLQTQGRTLNDARDALRREFIVLRYLEFNIKPKVPQPTRGELLALFEQGRQRWARPARRSMSLVEISVRARLPDGVSDPSPEQLAAARTEARRRIEAADSALRAGAGFADVARQHSDGLQAADGGSWGFVTADGVQERYRPALDALYQLDTGQVSGIVEGPDMAFLVRCDENDKGSEPTFEAVQPELKLEHYRTTYNRMIGEHVDELRKKARIEPQNLDLFFKGVLNKAPQPNPR